MLDRRAPGIQGTSHKSMQDNGLGEFKAVPDNISPGSDMGRIDVTLVAFLGYRNRSIPLAASVRILRRKKMEFAGSPADAKYVLLSN